MYLLCIKFQYLHRLMDYITDGCECIIYTDDIYCVMVFPHLDQETGSWMENLGIPLADFRRVDSRDMLLFTTVPKVSMYHDITTFLGVNDVRYSGLFMEDLHLHEVLEVLVTNRVEVGPLTTAEDPMVVFACNFVIGAPDYSPKLLGMIQYQATLVGDDVYPVDPIRCTRLEMESEMKRISVGLHAQFIHNLCDYHLSVLYNIHNAKARTFSEMRIVTVLYENYVSSHVSIHGDGKGIILWKFEDGLWKEVSTAMVWMELVRSFTNYLKRCSYDLDDVLLYLGSVSSRERVQRDLIHRLADDSFPSKLNTNISLIGMENGVYDVERGQLRDTLPGDYISMSTRNKLHPHMDEYRKKSLMKILSTVFPDKEILKYFIQSCAMLLEGENKSKVVYIWWGKGNNGKSMVEKLLNLALGDYATVAATSLITSKRSGADSATPQLSALEGKLVVFLQEPNPNEVIRIGMAKELSGGDRITTRALFRSPRTFVPKFKLVMVCNSVMEIPNIDVAFTNRLVVIPFKSTFYTKDSYDSKKNKGPYDFLMDTKLGRNIGSYASVFLHVLIEEYNRIKHREIVPPPLIRQLTKEYVESTNSSLTFIKKYLVPDKGMGDIPVNIIYQEYRRWVTQVSNRRPVEETVFLTELEKTDYVLYENTVMDVRCTYDF
jgi:P4 family phage/plasmid primase-like protien